MRIKVCESLCDEVIRCKFHQHSTSGFFEHRSQKRKKTVKLSVFFALLGSAHTKAAHRKLIKMTPDRDRVDSD